MDTRTRVCSKQQTYIIIEEVHNGKYGMPSLPKPLDIVNPEMTQIYRRVLQTCDFQDFLFDGKMIDGSPSFWQYVQDFVSHGKRITMHPTGQKQFLLVYSGFKNILRPIKKISGHLPEWMTRAYNLGTPSSPFIYGTDPIPNIQLHGNPKINFVSEGGETPPRAIAIYSGKTGKLTAPSDKNRLELIGKLLKAQITNKAH